MGIEPHHQLGSRAITATALTSRLWLAGMIVPILNHQSTGRARCRIIRSLQAACESRAQLDPNVPRVHIRARRAPPSKTRPTLEDR